MSGKDIYQKKEEIIRLFRKWSINGLSIKKKNLMKQSVSLKGFPLSVKTFSPLSLMSFTVKKTDGSYLSRSG
jgi:hypothetical protein